MWVCFACKQGKTLSKKMTKGRRVVFSKERKRDKLKKVIPLRRKKK
jgi:hypothetical protein